MDASNIFLLALFTLVGFALHAAWNAWKTRRLKKAGENPMEIPKIYQQKPVHSHPGSRDG